MRIVKPALVAACLLGAAGFVVAPAVLAQKPVKGVAEAPNPARHTAAFPGETRLSVKESALPSGGKATVHLRELKAGAHYYGTAWTPVPGAPSAAPELAKLLEVAAAAALKTEAGATLVSRRNVSIAGIPGLAYVIDLPQSKTRLRQQIFMVSGVLVEQTFTGPAGTENGRDAGRFFDSLKLLP